VDGAHYASHVHADDIVGGSDSGHFFPLNLETMTAKKQCQRPLQYFYDQLLTKSWQEDDSNLNQQHLQGEGE
jgi:hypothetical protein